MLCQSVLFFSWIENNIYKYFLEVLDFLVPDITLQKKGAFCNGLIRCKLQRNPLQILICNGICNGHNPLQKSRFKFNLQRIIRCNLSRCKYTFCNGNAVAIAMAGPLQLQRLFRCRSVVIATDQPLQLQPPFRCNGNGRSTVPL